MKLAIAALSIIAGALFATATPASADSSYWEQRARGGGPEYRQSHERHVVKRRHWRAADRRWRRPAARDDRYADAFPNPFRVERNDGRAHPTMNNDYWVQRSIYDFQDGKAADIKRYRD